MRHASSSPPARYRRIYFYKRSPHAFFRCVFHDRYLVWQRVDSHSARRSRAFLFHAPSFSVPDPDHRSGRRNPDRYWKYPDKALHRPPPALRFLCGGFGTGRQLSGSCAGRAAGAKLLPLRTCSHGICRSHHPGIFYKKEVIPFVCRSVSCCLFAHLCRGAFPPRCRRRGDSRMLPAGAHYFILPPVDLYPAAREAGELS